MQGSNLIGELLVCVYWNLTNIKRFPAIRVTVPNRSIEQYVADGQPLSLKVHQHKENIEFLNVSDVCVGTVYRGVGMPNEWINGIKSQ